MLSLIRQYTSSIASYTTAIDHDPTNPFLYINRSTTQSEMIDFVSSLDNGQQRITIDNDPVNRLKNQTNRVYNYDDALGDLNRAIELLPDFAYAYYNRANLYCLSGMLSEALEDYTHAIELNPLFGEAYYNRVVAQSLSPLLVQQDAIDKWDGKLPTYSGGGALPFINIGK